jgi:hypothetical protein
MTTDDERERHLARREAPAAPGGGALGDPAVAEKFNDLVTGSFVTQLVYVAAKLGIPDLLADAPMSAAEIALKTATHPRVLAAMLRALAAVGVFAEDPQARYSLTAVGAALRSYPGWRSQAILIGEEYYRAAAELLHTARTGEPAFERAFGSRFYEYAMQNRDAAARFGEVMTLTAQIRYADLTTVYDFSAVATMVDVGSGHGGLAAILLRANPAMRTILFDLAPIVEGAKRFLAGQQLAERCEFVSGDFFHSVPAGGDLYMLSSVIVNWDDEHAIAILRNCRNAMGADGDAFRQKELLLVEHALAPGKRLTRASAVASVAAYAIQGSITRTDSEYRSILERAGFELLEIRPLAAEPYAVVRARPR